VPDNNRPTSPESCSAKEPSTFDNLVAENALLRAQLDILRPESAQGSTVASSILGVRAGDQIVCGDGDYEQVQAALLLPVETAVEVYAAREPLAGLTSRVRVLVASEPATARRLAERHSSSMVLNMAMADFFRQQPDHSVDTVVLRQTALREASSPADRAFWTGEARRIARRQVVLVCEFAPERSQLFPFHPDDFRGDFVIINEDPQRRRAGREFCVIRSAEAASRSTGNVRAVLVSEWDTTFQFRPDDFLVCDHQIARDERLSDAGVAGMMVVPFKLLRASLSLPVQVLRSAVLNFAVLERYVEHMPTVLALGSDAEFVLDYMRRKES
jgi:hypothetical protein